MTQIDPDLIEDTYAFQRLLGFEIVAWSEGHATLHQPVKEHIGNRYGLPHGGVHAALLDTAMGFSGCWTGDPGRRQLAMTLTLNVSYLSRPKGKVLIAKGWMTGGGRKTFFCSGEIADETGERIATGSAAFSLPFPLGRQAGQGGSAPGRSAALPRRYFSKQRQARARPCASLL